MLKNLKNTKLVWKNKKITISDLFSCVIFIIVCDIVGYLSSLFQTEGLRTWYPLLEKSVLTPPSFVFAIVWGILYAILGISTFLAFRSARKDEKIWILFIFFAQLCFNLLWSIFFFGMRAPLFAFVEILFLLLITLNMMKLYKRFSQISYYLLYPYVLWIAFATYLNFVIVLKN
ncbi:MAG: tryptophan-rich sensory protein [bacterium]|nr:tryptophan-rich sensory protein [bacterium]